MTIKRMTFLQELLDFVGLGDRLHLEWISSAEAQKFVKVVTDFTEKIRKLGPNPVKSLPTAQMLPKPKALSASPLKASRSSAESPEPVKQPAQTA
jgi:F420-non-reducing hydrogenase iron-sulfur subunit